jgi:hypothetical protein
MPRAPSPGRGSSNIGRVAASRGVACSRSGHGARAASHSQGRSSLERLAARGRRSRDLGALPNFSLEGYVGHREKKLTRSNQSINRWLVKMDGSAI